MRKEAVSGKKKLQSQKCLDTSGRGLKRPEHADLEMRVGRPYANRPNYVRFGFIDVLDINDYKNCDILVLSDARGAL